MRALLTRAGERPVIVPHHSFVAGCAVKRKNVARDERIEKVEKI